MTLRQMVDRIQSKQDLIGFVEALVDDLRSRPADWENHTLDAFLSALASWLTDSDGYYRNHGIDVPATLSWKNIAEMLIAAKMYE